MSIWINKAMLFFYYLRYPKTIDARRKRTRMRSFDILGWKWWKIIFHFLQSISTTVSALPLRDPSHPICDIAFYDASVFLLRILRSSAIRQSLLQPHCSTLAPKVPAEVAALPSSPSLLWRSSSQLPNYSPTHQPTLWEHSAKCRLSFRVKQWRVLLLFWRRSCRYCGRYRRNSNRIEQLILPKQKSFRRTLCWKSGEGNRSDRRTGDGLRNGVNPRRCSEGTPRKHSRSPTEQKSATLHSEELREVGRKGLRDFL